MDKLHITQDDYGYWMLSLEQEDGTMSLLAHQFAAPEHLIENANELVSEGKVNAVVCHRSAPTPTQKAAARAASEDYKKPAPRKAGV